MKTYTIEQKNDNAFNGIETVTFKAQNIAQAISECGFSFPVFRWEGRQGEFNEYVEFDPRRSDGVVFIAQYNGQTWNVYENHPGRKGACITRGYYVNKSDAVFHAQKLAHRVTS